MKLKLDEQERNYADSLHTWKLHYDFKRNRFIRKNDPLTSQFWYQWWDQLQYRPRNSSCFTPKLGYPKCSPIVTWQITIQETVTVSYVVTLGRFRYWTQNAMRRYSAFNLGSWQDPPGGSSSAPAQATGSIHIWHQFQHRYAADSFPWLHLCSLSEWSNQGLPGLRRKETCLFFSDSMFH